MQVCACQLSLERITLLLARSPLFLLLLLLALLLLFLVAVVAAAADADIAAIGAALLVDASFFHEEPGSSLAGRLCE